MGKISKTVKAFWSRLGEIDVEDPIEVISTSDKISGDTKKALTSKIAAEKMYENKKATMRSRVKSNVENVSVKASSRSRIKDSDLEKDDDELEQEI